MSFVNALEADRDSVIEMQGCMMRMQTKTKKQKTKKKKKKNKTKKKNSMSNVLQFAQLFYEIYSVFCSSVVKNQLLRQTVYQFGPILPHFCGNLIKNQKKNKQKNKKSVC